LSISNWRPTPAPAETARQVAPIAGKNDSQDGTNQIEQKMKHSAKRGDRAQSATKVSAQVPTSTPA